MSTLYDKMVEVSTLLEGNFQVDDSAWDGSPFAWIRQHNPKTVGAIGEQMISGWFESNGSVVLPRASSSHDRIVDGKKIEMKFSTMWTNGCYRFSQIRDQDYDALACMGVSPHAMHCWVLPKSVVVEAISKKWILPQHGGASATETAWFGIDPIQPPDWIAPYGGRVN